MIPFTLTSSSASLFMTSPKLTCANRRHRHYTQDGLGCRAEQSNHLVRELGVTPRSSNLRSKDTALVAKQRTGGAEVPSSLQGVRLHASGIPLRHTFVIFLSRRPRVSVRCMLAVREICQTAWVQCTACDLLNVLRQKGLSSVKGTAAGFSCFLSSSRFCCPPAAAEACRCWMIFIEDCRRVVPDRQ